MAAPMVTSLAGTIRAKKGHKKQFPVKNTITSPFLTEWPQLQTQDEKFILQETQSNLVPYGAIFGKLPSKGKRKSPDSVDLEAKQKRAALRSQLALGLNEVTRSLERGELRLALVCRSAQPALMTNHLMALSATRNIPVACVYHLSDSLAPILQLKVIMAIGFKKLNDGDPNTFGALVNSIIEITPPVDIPWLRYKELSTQELKKVVTNIIFSTKVEHRTEPKQKGKKGKNKQMKTTGAIVPSHAMAPDHAQVGTSRDGTADTENTKAHSGASAIAIPEATVQVSPPEHGHHKVSTHNQSSVQLQPSELSTATVTKFLVQSADDASSNSLKRKSSTSPERPSNTKAKTVLKPNYKPVGVIPVKIIPKDMKPGKKQLKKQRKKNKKKNKKAAGRK
ncbi:ribonuclease P protein subunit p38-like [Asterias rubens]|uniref:ribonuclease P protein subunit p38-like n=1 Tax=Asterias rubens TaxID=7604 RepID=UPI001454FC9E|nr:ribonuclease P protein subunit p38-like [Asterias rubens]